MDSTKTTGASSPPRQVPGGSKPRRVPIGWVAPGPPPGPPERIAAAALGPEEELSWLLGDWRILQRKDGHRWSLDDFVTAWVARDVGRRMGVEALLDLGTGIGSVAFMLGWCFPDARVTGVEAQAISFDLAVRSAWLNGVEGRYHLVHHDLRTVFEGALPRHAWSLVTGTPPYFDDPDQTRSSAVQKEPCRFETRGGIGDYLAAMRLALRPDGRAVICHASRHRERVLAAIDAAGFAIERAVEVVPKRGREALVDVFALAVGASVAPLWEALVVRDASDQWTPEFLAVRLAMGMPPKP